MEEFNMKNAITIAAIVLVLLACNSPMPITANPDDHTTTTGTVGSAKMTTQLPEKAGKNLPIKDTIRSTTDTLRMQ